MTRPYVRVRVLSEDRVIGLQPGDLIGRSRAAALRLNSPRISEAHAFVSLREGQLKLLALRGRVARSGEPPVTELTLLPGMTIKLARDLKLLVEAVSLPGSLLGLTINGAVTPLLASEYSLLTDPPTLLTGYRAEAAGHIWSGDERWFLKLPEQPLESLAAGQRLMLGDSSIEVVELPLSELAAARTMGPVYARPSEPGLRIDSHKERCRVEKPDGSILDITGVMATMLHVMARTHPGHLHWAEVTQQIWFNNNPLPAKREQSFRSSFHRTRQRLRARLKESGVREDLFGQAGYGQWRLNLSPDDQLILHDPEPTTD